VDGAIVYDGLDLETSGTTLAVSGDAGPLIALLTGIPLSLPDAVQRARGGEVVPLAGEARLGGGSLQLMGRDVGRAEHRRALGVAPFDPPMPEGATVLEYLLVGARLAQSLPNGRRPDAERAALGALEQSGIQGGSKRPIRTLGAGERRALVLAQAAAVEPDVIVADRPLDGLDPAQGGFALEALRRLSEGRGLVVRIGTAAPESIEGALARTASDVAFFSRGELAFFGPPGAERERLYRVTVRCGSAELQQALARLGAQRLSGTLGTEGRGRFSFTLPEGKGPTDVLRAAAAVRASVVEIVPLM
jgi:ABC-type multidrug transport system ATPase subunit